MLNFTVGPVQSYNCVKEIGGFDVPYFRTPEFSEIMLENESLMKKFTHATEDSRVVFITGSGTASMEAAVINVFGVNDKVLIINGGSFGQRFVDLCELHAIDYDEIKLNYGCNITEGDLSQYSNCGYTGLLINACETSTGVKYDMGLISDFCKKNKLFLVVDAVSSFIADSFNMEKLEVDLMLTGSQKALSCPPGISIIVLSGKGVKRVRSHKSKCMYLDLCNALNNAERGQTPFTPAVGILLQINARLKEIERNGGIEQETRKIALLARDFREKIKDLPFEIVSDSLSNAVTPIHPLNASAYEIFNILKEEYNIWICPNGGELADKMFRVGHLGNLTVEDNDTLVKAFYDLEKRGVLR